jgi:hypothetical protein
MSIAGGLTMKRLVLVAATGALAALLLPAAALAKGATEATITGPGLGDGITLAGEGDPNGAALMRLAESAGFFPSVFVTAPNPMLSTRPTGRLGPRYRITWVMPGPDGGVDKLQQDLYPYATPSALSYMKPGQTYFGGERTVGGWYVGDWTLKNRLVAAGLPETPPSGGGSDFPWTIVAVLAGIAAMLSAVAFGAVRVRRRPGPATA